MSTGDNIGNNNDSSVDSHAIILPTPVPVIAHAESRIIVLTKLLSWLTATLLATAVIISLVSVTSERNDLRAQLSAQSVELSCRSAASTAVNRAIAERDNKLTEALANFGTEQFDESIVELKSLTSTVNDAILAQERALEACDKR